MQKMLSRFFGRGKKRDAELLAAAQLGDLAGVRRALDRGADVNALDPIHGETALHVTVEKENKVLVQFLLSRGANPNITSKQNRTPLIIAAIVGDRTLPIVELLLTGRADPSLTPKVGPYAGNDALFIAASQGANTLLRHLLTFGATPRVRPDGATLLHIASMGGNADTVAVALETGATVNDVDRHGATPLHFAVAHANKAAVVALLGHGAETEKRNNQGQTPVDLAAASSKPSILKLLFSHDAPAVVPAEQGSGINEFASPAQQNAHIRGMTLLEFSTEYYRNIRFQNVMMACVAQGSTPFETVGAYLDAGEDRNVELLRLPHLGVNSISRFNQAIHAAMHEPMPVSKLEQLAKRQDLDIQDEPLAELAEVAPLPVDEMSEPYPVGIKRTWYEKYLRLKAHHAQHGNTDVPHQWSDDPKLAAWVSYQRQKRKKDELFIEQIQLLDTLGFSWSLRERGTWDDRLQELVEFKNLFGHFDVPTSYPTAPKLRQFVSSTHFQFRTGSLDTDRITRLEDIGFSFGIGEDNAIEQTLVFTPHVLAPDFTLSGLTLTITGRLETLTQREATELAQQKGAVVVDKFSGNVDLLVVGSEPGTKLADAQLSGITLIDEKQFLNIVR